MKKHIPNFITSLNLLAGCFAVVFALTADLRMASWMIGLAAIFDFADGFAARFLKAQSRFGMVLDSLADVISFGMAPGAIMFSLTRMSYFPSGGNPHHILAYSAFLITIFSALRLAKFSIDDKQSDHFLGLPTPAMAILVASFPLILFYHSNISFIISLLQHGYVLVGITILLSVLMVVNIPLMALKFKTFGIKENAPKYGLMVIAAVLLALFHYLAIPMIIISYFILSAIPFRKI